MGKKLTDTSSDRDFQIIDEGTFIAVCTAVVCIGMQETYYGEKEQIKIRFEVPSERITYEKDGKEHEGPMVVWKTYTASLNEKANLRKDLESWRSRRFTEEELQGWDISAILGKPCSITIVHNEAANGRTYANVERVSGVPKGMSAPQHEGELLDFNNENYSDEEFEALPSWLQDKVRDGEALADAQIARTEEGNRRATEAAKSAPVPSHAASAHGSPVTDQGDHFTDDDIPF